MVRYVENGLKQKTGLLRFVFILVLLLSFPAAEAALIQVQVKPDQPRLDEAFQLVFSASEETDGPPDFSPLNQGFEILSQRQSSQSTWVNGESSQSINWILKVVARRAGRLKVPEIAFGSDRSVATEIEVTEAQVSGDTRPDLFMRVTVDSKTPYVQTQVIYTWRIYTRLGLSAANMSEPALEDALVVRLGDNRSYRSQLDGVDYQVIEGRYAIFPQQPGLLTIPPLALTAEVPSTRRSQPGINRFFNLQSTTTRRIKSDSLSLQVQGVPDVFDRGPWLGASQLELTQSWSDEGLTVKVGEPLTRTLSLRAVGVPASQLPDINMGLDDAGLKTYPEQPQLSERAFDNGLSSAREQKVAIIATAPGSYLLPEISLYWYNTQSGKVETASLPAVRLTVLAAPGQPQLTPGDNAPASSAAAVESDQISVSQGGVDDIWKWIALSLALGWSLTLAGLWYRHRQAAERNTAPAVTGKPQLNIRKYAVRLKPACLGRDVRQVNQILLEWGRASFDTSNLMDTAAHCPEALQAQLLRLNKSLYSGSEQDWDPQALYREFKAMEKASPDKVSQTDPLPPLYPDPGGRACSAGLQAESDLRV